MTRDAVRLVVVDTEGRILLFLIREPLHPEQGACWELPGGGLDPDETHIEAALRELEEETGIQPGAASIGPPTWRRQVTFLHAGERRLQREVVLRVDMDSAAPPVDPVGQSPDERDCYLGYRWWSPEEIHQSDARFYPSRLPALLRSFLDGAEIDEPFERFS